MLLLQALIFALLVPLVLFLDLLDTDAEFVLHGRVALGLLLANHGLVLSA